MQAMQRGAASRSGVPEHFPVQTAMGMDAQVPRSTGMCERGLRSLSNYEGSIDPLSHQPREAIGYS